MVTYEIEAFLLDDRPEKKRNKSGETKIPRNIPKGAEDPLPVLAQLYHWLKDMPEEERRSFTKFIVSVDPEELRAELRSPGAQEEAPEPDNPLAAAAGEGGEDAGEG